MAPPTRIFETGMVAASQPELRLALCLGPKGACGCGSAGAGAPTSRDHFEPSSLRRPCKNARWLTGFAKTLRREEVARRELLNRLDED
jgi:hypothetical protein